MTDEERLDARLEREPVEVECPICRHGQRLGSASGRCDQCGSEISLYRDRPEASRALDALVDEGRVAYLTEVGPRAGGPLWAVVANRAFRRPGGS